MTDWTEWAWAFPTRTATARLLLLALAGKADARGTCWPGRPWLMARTGLGVDAVKRGLRQLEAAGALTRERDRRDNGTLGTWVYTLTESRGQNATVDETHGGVTHHGTRGTKPADIEEALQKNVGADAPTGAQGAPEPRGASPKRARPRDLVWDALVAAMPSPPPKTKNGRGRWNAACAQLREAGYSPEDIRAASVNLARAWGEKALTPTSLATHIHEFLPSNPDADGPQSAREDAERWVNKTGRWVKEDREFGWLLDDGFHLEGEARQAMVELRERLRREEARTPAVNPLEALASEVFAGAEA